MCVRLLLAFVIAVGLPGMAASQSDEWRAAVQADLAAREYHPVQVGSGFQAPNRAHDLRATFTQDGVRLVRRTDVNPSDRSWSFGMSLRSVGRGIDRRAPQPALITTNGNRVTYDRGDVVEWYVNDADGLEQGFTLSARPAGKSDESLRIDIALTGNLSAGVNQAATRVELGTTGGVTALHLSKLIAWDANDRGLPAHFKLEGDLLSLVVDDTDAVYPIVIDPLATSPSWTAESNQVDYLFGMSVSSAGDVNGDGYGDVIVSSIIADITHSDVGRAYLYLGSSTGLAQWPAWTETGSSVGAEFGYSVSSAGDVNGDGYSDVIVGAWRETNDQNTEGMAHVYHGSAGGLPAAPNWSAEGNQDYSRFGISVSSAGDVNGDGFSDVIVGASVHDNGQTDEGRVYAYHGAAGGLGATAAWAMESNQAGAWFGDAVSGAGDVNGDGFSDIIVGAYPYDNDQDSEGRAFVYHGSSSGLGTTATWTAESNQTNSSFARSVSSAGDVNGDGFADVIVGCRYFTNGEASEGRAFVYHGSAGGVGAAAAWTAESNQVSANFADAVSCAGDVNGDGYADVLVGARQHDGGQTDEGRAFVYQGSAAGLTAAATWWDESDQAIAYFGDGAGHCPDLEHGGWRQDRMAGLVGLDRGGRERRWLLRCHRRRAQVPGRTLGERRPCLRASRFCCGSRRRGGVDRRRQPGRGADGLLGVDSR